MKEETKNEFMKVIQKTRELLEKNSEWRERYAGYAKNISDNSPTIKKIRSSFHEWSPLNVYLNISSAKSAKNSVGFELRYMGQTVAKLTGNSDKGHKLSTRGHEQENEDNFDCSIRLSGADWCGEDAKQFRNYFKHRTGARKDGARGNEEHRLQSMLLTGFSRREDKIIRHIRPVTMGGVRFPMPTPISASNPKDIKYSKQHGGGIDILTRTGTGGKATHLCIMELKKKAELPRAAMKQAIAYATFIRELLRSDAAVAWWELFGFKGKVPKPLELYVACVMPSNDNNEYSFGNEELNIDGDTIKLHYLYFYLTEGNDQIRIKPGDTTLAVME